jgi:hypothetical protein
MKLKNPVKRDLAVHFPCDERNTWKRSNVRRQVSCEVFFAFQFSLSLSVPGFSFVLCSSYINWTLDEIYSGSPQFSLNMNTFGPVGLCLRITFTATYWMTSFHPRHCTLRRQDRHSSYLGTWCQIRVQGENFFPLINYGLFEFVKFWNNSFPTYFTASLAAHTMAPTVCNRLLNAGILLQSQVYHRRIFGGKSDTGTVFSPSTATFPFHYDIAVPYPLTYISPTLCKLSKWQRL